ELSPGPISRFGLEIESQGGASSRSGPQLRVITLVPFMESEFMLGLESQSRFGLGSELDSQSGLEYDLESGSGSIL
uniref:Uncharacterized protein n=1 Tax=Cannabis sativa TaxID=3483 RepID=A0A803QRX0_CANSA